MKLSNDSKNKIKAEYSDWVESQYAGKSKEDRQKMGQFFTPPELSIKMLEKFEDLSGNVLDPTAGCGGLLAAAVIAGANPRKCYGIELDKEIGWLCRERLAKLGVPMVNIHQGDALIDDSYEFDEALETADQIYFDIKDLGFSKLKISLYVFGKKFNKKDLNLDFVSKDSKIIDTIKTLYSIFTACTKKKYDFYTVKSRSKGVLLNRLFQKFIGKSFDFKGLKILE